MGGNARVIFEKKRTFAVDFRYIRPKTVSNIEIVFVFFAFQGSDKIVLRKRSIVWVPTVLDTHI